MNEQAFNPNIVVVDIIQPPRMNPKKRQAPLLMSEFNWTDPATGETKVIRFKDKNGQVFSPRLPMSLDITNESDKRTYLGLLAYKSTYCDRIVIHDPGEKARKKIEESDKRFEAMSIIRKLEAQQEYDRLGALLRVIVGGSVKGITQQILLSRLKELAESEPESILQIEQDVEQFEKRSFVAKAVEQGFLTIDNRGHYKNRQGLVLAQTEDEMTYLLDKDVELKKAITRQMTGQTLTEAVSIAADATLTKEEQKLAKEVAGIAEDVSVLNVDPDRLLGDEEEAVEEEHIIETVGEAIKANFFDTAGRKFIYDPAGGTVSKTELLAFFTRNPRQAKELEETVRKLTGK